MTNSAPTAGKAILAVIAAFPLAMLTVVIWAVNRDQPHIGPFPFILFWIVAWVFLTPFFMFAVYRLDHRWYPEDDDLSEGDDDVA